MPTKDQTRANRANARRSTGPRSDAGKAKSSLNALKHGLRAQNPVLPDENTADFDILIDELEDQFQPQTAVEWTLLRQLADSEWRMRRVPCLEAGLIAAKINESARYFGNYPERLPDDDAEADLVVIGTAAANDANDGDTFSKLSRYEARLSHRYFKALEHLQKIQSLRNQPESKPQHGSKPQHESQPQPQPQPEPRPQPGAEPETPQSPRPDNQRGNPQHSPQAKPPQPNQSPVAGEAAGEIENATRKSSANQKHSETSQTAEPIRTAHRCPACQTNPIRAAAGPATRRNTNFRRPRPRACVRFARALWDTGA